VKRTKSIYVSMPEEIYEMQMKRAESSCRSLSSQIIHDMYLGVHVSNFNIAELEAQLQARLDKES